jgi:hypothetical protein
MFKIPTFKDVDQVLIENHINESPASVRARLVKMYNEAVKKGVKDFVGETEQSDDITMLVVKRL